MSHQLPLATPEPCNECPWRRIAARGYLGPHTPLDWIKMAHGEGAIACHKTVVVTDPLEGTGDWEHPKLRQCRGAAIFRANVGKSPRDGNVVTGPAETEKVFGRRRRVLGAPRRRAIRPSRHIRPSLHGLNERRNFHTIQMEIPTPPSRHETGK